MSTTPDNGIASASGSPQTMASEDMPERPATPLTSVQAQIMKGTPVGYKTSGSQVYSSNTLLRRADNENLALESNGRWTGPVPVKEFLETYLPVTPDAEKDIEFADVAKARSEGEKSVLFVKRINDTELGGLRFADTHNHRQYDFGRLGPDVCGYRPEDFVHVKRDEKGEDVPRGEKESYGVDFVRMVMWVEMKSFDTDDPLDDNLGLPKTKAKPSKSKSRAGTTNDPTPASTSNAGALAEQVGNPTPFEPQLEKSKLVRGQLASYAAAQAGGQFLKHFFSVIIFGKYARLMRWDRSCVVVSERFEYGSPGSNYLGAFFHRFSLLSPEQRGEDLTVTTCNDQIPDRVKTRLKSTKKKHREFRKMTIPDRDDPNKHHPHIISYPPPYQTRSPFGRATRSMQAYDLTTQRVVFVKDYWRPTGPDAIKEGEVYRKLKEAEVRHTVPFGHGNDLTSHTTVDLRGREWAPKQPGVLQNYRMSLKVVGHPLHDFKNTRQLVEVVADAMEGHDNAYFDAKILHRDISAGNIIIAPKRDPEEPEDPEVDAIVPGSGLIIDWDLSVSVANPIAARQIERTGTWQFISGHLLENPSKIQSIEDDRESALYVICWNALRFSKNSAVGRDLGYLLGMFDEVDWDNRGNPRGGRGKRELLSSGRGFPAQFNVPLDAILATVIKTFSVRYGIQPAQEDIDRYHQIVKMTEDAAYSERELLQELLSNHPVHIYTTKTENMKRRCWLVDCLRERLQATWPNDDHQVNKVGSAGALKRTRDNAALSTGLTASGLSWDSNKRHNSGSSGVTYPRPDEEKMLDDDGSNGMGEESDI